MNLTLNRIRLLTEFFGTFIISICINLSTQYQSHKQVIHWPLIFTGFFSAIYITKNISGGHLNPSTTLSIILNKENRTNSGAKPSNKQQLFYLYFIFQILGGFSACFIASLLNKNNIFRLNISENIKIHNAFLAEIIFSFIYNYSFLCLSIVNS